MSALVTIVGGQAVTTSIAIADGTENQHKNVLELIRTYKCDLEEFGGVAFETQPFETQGGTQQREVAHLNEQQATLLVTYMRNSEIVRDFKKRLVKAFWEMAQQQAHAIPQTFAQALMLAAQQAERIEQQQAQLEQQKPAVEFVDRFVEAKSAKGFREVAKILGLKEREFIADLAADGIIFKQGANWLPKADHQHAGRFTVKAGEANGHAFHQTRFTPDGIAWVAKRYSKAA